MIITSQKEAGVKGGKSELLIEIMDLNGTLHS